jgi:hypothetical protein
MKGIERIAEAQGLGRELGLCHLGLDNWQVSRYREP